MSAPKTINKGKTNAKKEVATKTDADDSFAALQENKQRFSRSLFASNCYDVHCQELYSSLSFSSVDLVGHKDVINIIEFSDDGTLFSSGGEDSIVRLWPISKVAAAQVPIVPIEMQTSHKYVVTSLAFSQDNSRLFSGGVDGKILIHDIQTYVSLLLLSN